MAIHVDIEINDRSRKDGDAMRIRLANTSDLAAIIACEDLAFNLSARQGYIKNVSPDGELASQIRNGAIHAMVDAKRVLGYISFVRNFDHLFITAVAVLPNYRLMGLGRQLLDFAEQQAAGLGLRSVRLFTDGMMPGNLIFYQRQGYRETGRCIEGEFSRVFYRKIITPSAGCHAAIAVAG